MKKITVYLLDTSQITYEIGVNGVTAFDVCGIDSKISYCTIYFGAGVQKTFYNITFQAEIY